MFDSILLMIKSDWFLGAVAVGLVYFLRKLDPFIDLKGLKAFWFAAGVAIVLGVLEAFFTGSIGVAFPAIPAVDLLDPFATISTIIAFAQGLLDYLKAWAGEAAEIVILAQFYYKILKVKLGDRI